MREHGLRFVRTLTAGLGLLGFRVLGFEVLGFRVLGFRDFVVPRVSATGKLRIPETPRAQ